MAWYTSPGGTTCVAAYNAVGATSLANSYVNLANPGTFDAAPGVAPTWAYGTGWTFNGTTQYLTTGVVPVNDRTWSMIVRFSGGSGTASGMIGKSDGAGKYFYIYPRYTDTIAYYGNGGEASKASGATSGVLAIAGASAYRNGVSESITIPVPSGSSTRSIDIGHVNGVTVVFWPGNIQAVAIYSGTLSGADVATITTAMNALPVASGAVAKILQAHGPYLGAR